jgi:hypothetical protein
MFVGVVVYLNAFLRKQQNYYFFSLFLNVKIFLKNVFYFEFLKLKAKEHSLTHVAFNILL